MYSEVATCRELAAVNSKTASDDTCAPSATARRCSSPIAGNQLQKSALPKQDIDSQLTFTDVLKKLEAEGKIRLPKRPLGKFRAVPSRGKPGSRMIIEDRR